MAMKNILKLVVKLTRSNLNLDIAQNSAKTGRHNKQTKLNISSRMNFIFWNYNVTVFASDSPRSSIRPLYEKDVRVESLEKAYYLLLTSQFIERFVRMYTARCTKRWNIVISFNCQL